MKIKALTNFWHADKAVAAGETIDVSPSAAKWLIEQGAAEELKVQDKKKGD